MEKSYPWNRKANLFASCHRGHIWYKSRLNPIETCPICGLSYEEKNDGRRSYFALIMDNAALKLIQDKDLKGDWCRAMGRHTPEEELVRRQEE